MRIGIDNYGLHPLGLNAMETLRWALAHGAQGVQFSGLDSDERKRVDAAYLKDLSQFASDNGLYIEWGGGQHIPLDMSTWKPKDIFEINRRSAEQAAVLRTRIVRSCSAGLMRWNPENPKTEWILEQTANALRAQRSMLKDHGVVLAIETHFEFTTFELLRLFEMGDAKPGDYLGVCLDTMNLLTMLEDPVSATERILPWVVCTHIKDGGLLLDSDGLVSFPAGIGEGIIDLKDIIRLLTTSESDVDLSIEDHGGAFDLPVFDPRFLSEFPDLTVEELSRLLRLVHMTREAMEAGRCSLTEREKWPGVCEERLSQDIQTLRKWTAEFE